MPVSYTRMTHYTPLYTHYTHTIHTLYTHYTHTIHTLYTHYRDFAKISDVPYEYKVAGWVFIGLMNTCMLFYILLFAMTQTEGTAHYTHCTHTIPHYTHYTHTIHTIHRIHTIHTIHTLYTLSLPIHPICTH